MASIEENLARFILDMQRGPELRAYYRECLVLWRRVYGDAVVERIKRRVQEGMKK